MSQRNGDDAGVSFRITNPTAHTSSGSGRSQQASTSQGHRNGYGRQYSHTRYESDSESEEDDHGGKRFQRRAGRDESITGIDHKGIRSSNASKKEKALVIPTAPNKDFRRAAIELRAKREGREVFVPGQAPSMQGATAQNKRVLTDADRQFLESESNVQRIGDKLASGGIRIGRQTAAQVTDEQGDSTDMQVDSPDTQQTPKLNGSHESQEPVAVEEDADALALRELLADKSDEERQAKVHIIPQAVTEEEAYALDVADRPDTPDMDAYQRVPIEDFGAALLRGMGGGTKKAKPKVEAWVPKPRTALLGIGAKSREETFGADWVAQQDGKKGGNRREQMRFMPLQKVDRPSASATPAPSAIQDGKAHASSSRRGRDEIDYSDDDKERRRRKHRRDSRDRSPVSGSERDSGKHRRRDYSRSPREADRHGSSRRPHEERERDKDRRSDRERHRDRDRDRDRDKYDSRDRSGRNSREKDYTSSRSDYDKDRDRRRDR